MISIIIPVYNTASYLDQCLQSVMAQSYTNWECILVDDGSTDNSGEICESYASKDHRIQVVRKKNQGVSFARNEGISLCSGDYICFIDSDDWIEPNYLETMISYVGDSELVVSGQIREFPHGKVVLLIPQCTCEFPINDANADIYVNLDSSLLLYAPHEKLYRADIIKTYNLQFQIGCNYGEDLIFNYQYLEYVKSMSTIQLALYHYRMGEGTLSTVLRPKQFHEDYNQWKTLKSFYIRRELWNEKAKEYLYKRLWGIVYDGIFLFPKLKNPTKDYLKEILSIPEINDLKEYQNDFHCAGWIKWAILHRVPSLFYFYFMMMKIGGK